MSGRSRDVSKGGAIRPRDETRARTRNPTSTSNFLSVSVGQLSSFNPLETKGEKLGAGVLSTSLLRVCAGSQQKQSTNRAKQTGSARENGAKGEIKTFAVGNKSTAATKPFLSASYAAQSETAFDWYAGNAS